ncbi:uncharacterized protein LOC133790607 [Humulus lupulus]|uniref:uncharacterized protein LOC133790607 n=1 Tax=Humulus lupulus TaxID=3486 RepID=UPI002B404E5A|nr:uncharacterized protein LOC133790607 [Humulus lupulus]
MAYVPPHKRTYSKNDDERSSSSSQISVPKPELPPPLFNKTLKLNSPGTCSSNGHCHEMVYAYEDIFKWFAVGFDNDHSNHFPPSLHLQPVFVESRDWKIVKRQALYNTSVHDLTKQSSTRSPWEYIAENLLPDLLSSFEDLSSKMGFQILVEAKPTLVTKFGKVLFRGKPSSVNQESVTTTNLLSEDLMRPLRSSFYTSIPNSYVEYITKEAASKNGLEFEKDKEAYLVFFSESSRAEEGIFCKCKVLKEDGKLHRHKIKHGHVRHMLRDISCLEKNMDMRLDLCTKKTVTALADDDMKSINDLIDSAILDKEVKGGLRWPLGKSSASGDKFGVTSVWHVTSKTYKNPSLMLRIKDVDRYRVWSSAGEATREVDIRFKGVVSELMKQDVDTNLISEMLKDGLKVLWNDFLCCEQFP